MEKRGQFLIIASVILGIIITSLIATQNSVIKDSDSLKKFNSLCDNYKNEIFKISSYAVNNGKNESELIKDFSINFSKYARINDKNFAFFYIYGNNNSAIVFNNLNKTINIYDGNIRSLNGNCTANFNNCIERINNANILIISNETEKINKTYNLSKNNRFYVFIMTIKDGEKYVCE